MYSTLDTLLNNDIFILFICIFDFFAVLLKREKVQSVTNPKKQYCSYQAIEKAKKK